MKAFDSITDNSIWDALKTCALMHEYIKLLKRLYKNQKATVMTDEESDMFEIKRGTKQGDPLSSLFFNCSADGIERRLSTLAKKKKKWVFALEQRSRLPHEYALC